MFTPEFRNRLDAIIPFKNLGPEIIARVVDKFIMQLEAQLADRHVTFELSAPARKWLSDKGYKLYGALARVIQEHIKKPLAEELLFGRLTRGGVVKVKVEDGKLAFDIVDPPSAAPNRPPGHRDGEIAAALACAGVRDHYAGACGRAPAQVRPSVGLAGFKPEHSLNTYRNGPDEGGPSAFSAPLRRDADAAGPRSGKSLHRRQTGLGLHRRVRVLQTALHRPAHCSWPPADAHYGGAKLYLKRDELNHTGAHKINNVMGQALLARRMGKTKIIAETGAGQHGVATATCALFGMECEVYMGAEDVRRQKPNVDRMRLLGATVVPVTSGSGEKDAMNEALRAWVAKAETHFYIIGTVANPHLSGHGAGFSIGDRRGIALAIGRIRGPGRCRAWSRALAAAPTR